MIIPRWKSFNTGYLGGALILSITLVFRILFNGPFLPEIIALKIFSTVPGEIESYFVSILGSYAKYLAVLGAAIVLVIFYGLSGILYVGFDVGFKKAGKISKVFLFSIFIGVLHILLVLILDSTYPRPEITGTITYLLVAHLFYGLTLIKFYPKPPVEDNNEIIKKSKSNTRRIFIKRIGPAAIGLAILIYGIDKFLLSPSRTPAINDVTIQELYTKEITPVETFYRTDISLIPPNIDPSQWTLIVDGEVENISTFTFDQLKTLTSIEEYATLSCISNNIGGPYIGTALWEGIHLSTVLKLVNLKPEAKYVVFYSSDGYSVAIPLEIALREGTILAYRMNGEDLSNIHGFPIRAIVPGIYGMMNTKWIRRIEVVSEEYVGYWQTRGWSKTAQIETTSTIKIPQFGMKISGATPIAGIAFAGDRGISKVEVSTDGGQTWSEALKKDPLSKYTWILWAIEWIPKNDGNTRLIVKATDKDGKVQTSNIRGTFPDGATGYHALDMTVNTEST